MTKYKYRPRSKKAAAKMANAHRQEIKELQEQLDDADKIIEAIATKGDWECNHPDYFYILDLLESLKQ